MKTIVNTCKQSFTSVIIRHKGNNDRFSAVNTENQHITNSIVCDCVRSFTDLDRFCKQFSLSFWRTSLVLLKY